MKKTLILMSLLAFLISVTSCDYLNLSSLETQVQKHVTPENIALAISASFLHSHPEADMTLLQVADELRTLSDGGVLDLETAYAKVEAGLGKHNFEYKKEVLFLLDGLFDQYAYIFDSRQVDVTEYRDTLIQFANGIDEAIALQNARETLSTK